MWMEKLTDGALRVLTPLGPRCVKPSLWQRIYLLWVFRNFQTLPMSVLSAGQKKRIERICAEHGFISQHGPVDSMDFAILGTLEQRPAVPDYVPPRQPAATVRDSVGPFAADQGQS